MLSTSKIMAFWFSILLLSMSSQILFAENIVEVFCLFVAVFLSFVFIAHDVYTGLTPVTEHRSQLRWRGQL